MKTIRLSAALLAAAILLLAAIGHAPAQEPPAVGVPSAAGDSAGAEQKTIDLDIKDAEIVDILRMFARTQHLNIAAGPEVSGKVTIVLRQLPWPEALSVILRTAGYDYVREGSVYRIVVRKPFVSDFSATTPQVQIESRIVEVGNDDSRTHGVMGSWLDAFNRLDPSLSGSISTSFPLGTTGLTAAMTNQHIDALLQLLEREAKVNILSSPRIVVLNNQNAKILVGDKIPFRSSETTAGSGVTVSYTMQEIGVRLSVTPQVIEGGQVVLTIQTDVSTLKELRQEGSFQVPVIGTREASTKVMIPDGATLAIGGLIKEEHRTTISRVPLLGRIPFLGYLFQHKSSDTVKSELLIFITPKILTPVPAGN